MLHITPSAVLVVGLGVVNLPTTFVEPFMTDVPVKDAAKESLVVVPLVSHALWGPSIANTGRDERRPRR